MILVTGYPEWQECIDALDLGIHEILLRARGPLVSGFVVPVSGFSVGLLVKEGKSLFGGPLQL